MPKDKDKHNNNIQNCRTAKHQEPSPFTIASITVVTSDIFTFPCKGRTTFNLM